MIRRVTKLDGKHLVLATHESDDGRCRAEVRFTYGDVCVMVQTRETRDLAVAAIARDLSTYAMLALASLPTIGMVRNVVECVKEDE